jgi:Arc/MetJ-type ribon-helix-helix transcriptional regulator
LKAKLVEAKNKIKECSAGLSPEELEELDWIEDLNDILEDDLDAAEDKVDLFQERAEEISEMLREKIRRMKQSRAEMVMGRPMEIRIPEIPPIRIPEIKIPDVGSLIKESLSSAWSGGPSAIVSSVRLPQADLNLIDALVNAGIFKSRNEGIAFFAHKGIEGSKEWLARVKEKLEEIRKLQEETKHELEKALGEPKPEMGEHKGEEDKKGPSPTEGAEK